ncbi:MAG TPA: hypothetical protein VFK17_10370 [Gaiellaceae bacterium]|jgi:uncharacterized membrane protein YphA (DoxX/SURF4 family)|nr:hypothetical protein [Gaiellaceae bacterium]
MSSTTLHAPAAADDTPIAAEIGALRTRRNDAAYHAYALLRIGFTVLPILFGIDKFTNALVHWDTYLAPWIDRIMPGDAHQFMYFVGAVEIVAGLSVLVKPRYGSWVVAAWLAGIVVNLFTYSGYYDIAMRDFGLMLAALTLARLASIYDPRWHMPARPRHRR